MDRSIQDVTTSNLKMLLPATRICYYQQLEDATTSNLFKSPFTSADPILHREPNREFLSLLHIHRWEGDRTRMSWMDYFQPITT